jgi:hypothetical protein
MSGIVEIVIIHYCHSLWLANVDYVKEQDLSSLTGIFGKSSDEESPDNEKLMHLYWNRNELKKEFAGLRKEQFRLNGKIREQDGVCARLEQQLGHIEGLLINPESARSVLVFYQLRSVALRCETKLATLAEQLKQQQEQKLNELNFAEWNEYRAKEAGPIRADIVQRHDNILHLKDQLQVERRRLESLKGIFAFFKRRSVAATIAKLENQITADECEENGLRALLDEIDTRIPPDIEGLDTPTKRTINCMIISYAQQLYTEIADDELVGLIKESREKSAGAVVYGTESECEEILARIRNSLKALDRKSDFADIMQRRAKLIASKALFDNDTDAVPVLSSVATLFKINTSGNVQAFDVNLLEENYWQIATVLSR